MAKIKKARNPAKENPIIKDDKKEIVTHYFPTKKSVAGVRELDQNENLNFLSKWRLKHAPHKSYVITMMYSNGTTRTFVIKSNGETFMHRKRMYYLRYENAQYDLTQGSYHLYFNEDFPVPIDREVKKLGNAAWFSVTPDSLAPLVKMELVKALVSSTELNKYLQMIIVICCITLFASLAAAGILINNLRG